MTPKEKFQVQKIKKTSTTKSSGKGRTVSRKVSKSKKLIKKSKG